MAFFARPQSTAVRITSPPSQDQSSPQHQPQTPRKDSTQRQCRNIVIYGHCKFQDKGCLYYHPPTTPTPSSQDVANPPQQPPSSSDQHPDSPPAPVSSTTTAILSAQAINAPVFVPRSSSTTLLSTGSNLTTPTAPTAAQPSASSPNEAQAQDTSPSPTSPSLQAQAPAYDPQTYQEPYDLFSYQDIAADAAAEDLSQSMEALDPMFYDSDSFAYAPTAYDTEGLDGFYTHPPVFMRQPLNYLLYTPSLPEEYVASNIDSHFVPASNALRQLLQSRSETIREVAPSGSGLPDEIQGYHTFVPLENVGPGAERRKFGSWLSVVYRAIRTADGRPYALRRIENFRLMHQSAFAAIEMWTNLRHPNIVPVREAFTTKAFNDNSLVVVFAYFPRAQTLFDLHFRNRPPQTPTDKRLLIPERTLWSYIIQLGSAIRKVHELRQPVRMVDPTKILITGQNRLRIGSCGVIDVLMHGTVQDVMLLQQEDLTMFGRLVFSLACSNVSAWTAPQFQKSLDHISRFYGSDLKSVALYLISKPSPHKNIEHLMEMIRPRIQAEMEEALLATDRFENELLGELENARLVRLLCKFGFINERPEFAREPRWSETGDRYIIKLFRDYVFHQVDEHGNPVLNMAHVLTCLNKLDAGTEERIMLVARDEQSCLVVSYKEIKACIEGAFNDLARPTKTGMVQFQPSR